MSNKSKVKAKEIENPLVCNQCGSTLVQQKIWIDPNTGQRMSSCGSALLEDSWCTNCEENHSLVLREEYEQQNHQHEIDHIDPAA